MQIQMYTQKEKMKYENIDAGVKDIRGKVHTHWHDFYEIELILRGSGSYVVDGKGFEIKKGDLFFMTPASFHNAYFGEGTRIVNIMFKSDLCDKSYLCSLFNERSFISTTLDDADTEFIRIITKNIENCLNQSPVDERYAITLLNCIIGKISQISAKTSPSMIISPVQKAILYIQNNFRQQISLTQIAEIANYSPNYLSEQFHKHTGMTFKNYLNNLRFMYAEKLLLYTDLSITDICFESGFNDYAHFMYAFKNKYHTSPNKFRKTYDIHANK